MTVISNFGVKIFRWGRMHLHFLKLPKSFGLAAALLGNTAAVGNEDRLLSFIQGVILGRSIDEDYSSDEFQAEWYTAKIVERNGKKMLKIYCHLLPEYGKDATYISPADFFDLTEIWIKERRIFDKNPKKYMEEMIRKGAIVLRPEDCRDMAMYKKKLSEAKYGVIEDWREAKSDNPGVLPLESSGKGKTDESSHPWWHFWK